MTDAPSRRTALITGASAGLGAAFARLLAAEGFDLVLVARREERLQALAQELQGQHGITAHVRPADLADPAAPQRLHDGLTADGIHVDMLIANAGYTVGGAFIDSAWDKQAALLEVMVTGLAHLNHLFLPDMVERGWGRVINVSSLAGHLPAAGGGTLYSASKSFVIRLCESLNLENMDKGVHVCALCPGFTYTEFHDVLGNRETVNKLPKFMWMDAETVVRQGYEAVEAGRPVIINGRINNLIVLFARLIPQRLAHVLMARNKRNIGKKPA